MKKFLIFVIFAVVMFITFFIFPEGTIATLFSTGICILVFYGMDRTFDQQNTEFLKRVFLLALAARIFLAVTIYSMEWENIFGPDAETYDIAGWVLSMYWNGLSSADSYGVIRYGGMVDSGWGMNYLVGIVYYISGRNPLAVQFISCALGAATVPVVYYCANKIFDNIRVAKYTALIIAFYPAMIIWSSQMLKDGILVFLLALTMACVIRLHHKIDPSTIIVMIGSLFGVLSMRSYVFYMVMTAIIGGFVVGAGKTSQEIGKRLAALLIIGISLGYLSFYGSSADTINRYADLDRLQTYRSFQAEGAGFSQETDITTIEGSATILPVGIANILFAPFPWQILNIKQALILPEMLFWWACIPFLISGLLYTIKNRLKPSIPILTFTAMLTVSYAIVQSNIGAAYRQRTQIQVFLFIFVAVGWALFKEKRENKDLAYRAKSKRNLARI